MRIGHFHCVLGVRMVDKMDISVIILYRPRNKSASDINSLSCIFFP